MKKKKFFLLSLFLSHYYLIHTSTYLLTYLLTPTDDHIIKVIQQTIFYIVFVKTPQQQQQQQITSVVKDLLISILPPLSFALSFLSFHFFIHFYRLMILLCVKQNKAKAKAKIKQNQPRKQRIFLLYVIGGKSGTRNSWKESNKAATTTSTTTTIATTPTIYWIYYMYTFNSLWAVLFDVFLFFYPMLCPCNNSSLSLSFLEYSVFILSLYTENLTWGDIII